MFVLVAFISIFIQDGFCVPVPSLWDGQCAWGSDPSVMPSNAYGNNRTLWATNTPKQCIDMCRTDGFSFAGPNYGSYCLCGNIASITTLIDDQAECNYRCPGNINEICGGHGHRMGIYMTGTWDIAYSSPDEREIMKNSLVTEIIKLGKEWRITIGFNPTIYSNASSTNVTEPPSNHLTNLLHLTTVGQTITAIYFDPSYGMKIEFFINDELSYETFELNRPAIDEWTYIQISQEILGGQYKFYVGVGLYEVLSKVNFQPVEFDNVLVYASDPSYVAQPGFVKDITILTKPEACCANKTVGTVAYHLVEIGDTTSYNCKDVCVYKEDGGDDTIYCFADGDEDVECTA